MGCSVKKRDIAIRNTITDAFIAGNSDTDGGVNRVIKTIIDLHKTKGLNIDKIFSIYKDKAEEMINSKVSDRVKYLASFFTDGELETKVKKRIKKRLAITEQEEKNNAQETEPNKEGEGKEEESSSPLQPISEVLKYYPEVFTKFDSLQKVKFLEACIVNFTKVNEKIIKTDKDLKDSILSLYTNYLKDLIKFAKKEKIVGENFEITLNNFDIKAINKVKDLLQKVNDHFSKNTPNIAEFNSTLTSNKPEDKAGINAFFAYHVLSDFNGFVERYLSDFVQILKHDALIPFLDSNIYKLKVHKAKSTIFGDSTFTDAKTKASAYSKIILNSTPLYRRVKSGEYHKVPLQYITYDDAIRVVHKLMEYEHKGSELSKDIINLGKDPVNNLEKLIKKVIAPTFQGFTIDEKNILASLYHHLLSSDVQGNDNKSLRLIVTQSKKSIKSNETDILQDVVQELLRSDETEYLVVEDGKVSTLRRTISKNSRFDFTDKIEYEILSLGAKNINKLKNFEFIEQDRSIKIKITIDENLSMIISPFGGTTKFQNAEGKDVKLFNLPKENIIKHLNGSTIITKEEELNFIKVLKLISDTIPGLDLLGPEMDLVSYIFRNITRSEDIVKTITDYFSPIIYMVGIMRRDTVAYFDRKLDGQETGEEVSFKAISLKDVKVKNLTKEDGTYNVFNDKTQRAILEIVDALVAISGKVEKNINSLAGNSLPKTRQTSVASHLPLYTKDFTSQGEENIFKSFTVLQQGEIDTTDKEGKSKKVKISNFNLIEKPRLQLEISSNGSIKNIRYLTNSEYYSNSILNLFLGGFADAEENYIYIQPTVYSDKSSIPAYPININKPMLLNGEATTLKTASSENILTAFYTSAGNYYKSLYNKVKDKHAIINESNKDITLDEFRKIAEQKDVDIIEGLDFVVEKRTIKDDEGNEITKEFAVINPILKFYAEVLFEDKSQFDLKINKEKTLFIRDLLSSGFELKNAIKNVSNSSILKEEDKTFWRLGNTYALAAYIDGDEVTYITTVEDLDLLSKTDSMKNIKLNPLLEKYFSTQLLLGFEIRNLVSGTELAHMLKGAPKEEVTLDNITEFEADLVITQYKRETAVPLPMKTMGLCLEGVPEQMKSAVMPDMRGGGITVNGETINIQALDGSTYELMLSNILINGSLQSSRGGEDLKLFLYSRDLRTGVLHQDKYASFAMTNERIRNSLGSEVNLLALVQKMMNIDFDEDSNVPTDGFGKPINYSINLNLNYKGEEFNLDTITDGKGIVYKDGYNYYNVTSIKKANDGGKYTYVVTRKLLLKDGTVAKDKNGKTIFEKYTVDITNLYKLYEVLGGCFSGKFVGGAFVYDDSSWHALAGYVNSVGTYYKVTGGKVTYLKDINESDNALYNLSKIYYSLANVYQPLKHKFIYNLTNGTARKVGQTNVNDKDAWTDPNKKLRTMTTYTKGLGLVQDYDHIVTTGDSELTEFSQVLTAMMAGGKSYRDADRVFVGLANITMSELKNLIDSVKSFIESQNPDNKKKLYKIIGEILIDNIKDENLIKNQILTEVRDIFQKDIKSDTKIAFSSPENFAQTLSIIGSTINRTGIKRRYPGLGAIMCPSYNIIQLYNINGARLTYSDLIRKMSALYYKRAEDNSGIINIYDAHTNTLIGTFTDGDTNWEFSFNENVKPSEMYRVISYILNNVSYKNVDLSSININLTVGTSTENTPESLLNIGSWQDFKTNNITTIVNNYLKVLDAEDIISIDDLDGISIGEVIKINSADENNINEIIPESKNGIVEITPENKNDIIKKIRNSEVKLFVTRVHSKPTNLKPTNATFKIKGTNIVRSIWDLDAVKQAVLSKNPKEHALAVERALRELRLNKVAVINNTEYEVSDINVEPYECILPKIYKQEFGLTEGDSLSYILEKKEEFFKLRFNAITSELRSKVQKSFNYNNGLESYSADILLSNGAGESRCITFKKPLFTRLNLKKAKIQDNFKYLKINGKKIPVQRKVNGKWEDFIIPITDHNFPGDYFYCASTEALKYLYDADNFKAVTVFNNNENISKEFENLGVTLEEDKNGMFIKNPDDSYFKEKFTSFEKSLELLVARIPAQTMQSFMKMKVVAFAESDKNVIYVSHYQLFLQGSDFDIDKAYAMGLNFTKEGKLIGWSPLFSCNSKKILNASIKLPLPTGFSSGFKEDGKNITEFITKINEINASDLDEETKQAKILETKAEMLSFIGNSTEIFIDESISEDIQREILSEINKHNLYFSNLSNKTEDKNLPPVENISEAYKNFVSINIMEISSDLINLSASQTPVSMGEVGEFANNSPLGKELKQSSWMNPTTVPKVTKVNMDGKDGIGIAANGEKCFFTLLYYYYNQIDKDNAEKLIFNKEFTFFDDNGNFSKKVTKNVIANINLEHLKGIDPEILQNKRDFIKSLIEGILLEKYSEEEIQKIIEDQLKLTKDQSLVISALLTAATDNAKELALSKLNANPEYMKVYLYAAILGIDFKDIATFMTSEVVTEVINFQQEDIILGVDEKPIEDLIPEIEQASVFYEVHSTLSRFSTDFSEVTKRLSDKIGLDLTTGEPIRLIDYYNKLDKLIKDTNKESNGSPKIKNLSPFIAWALENNHAEVQEVLTKDFLNKNKHIYGLYSKALKVSKIRKHPNYREILTQLHNIILDANEVTTLSTLLSANQGFKVTDWEQVDQLLKIENNVRRAIEGSQYYFKAGTSKQEEVKKTFVGLVDPDILRTASELGILDNFNFIEYLNPKNAEYREITIKLFDVVKRTFNYLDVINEDPRYKALYDVRYFSHLGNTFISSKFRSYYNIRREFSKTTWEKSNHLGLRNALDSAYIFSWIRNNNIKLKIDENDFIFKDGNLVKSDSEGPIDLSSLDNIATFKYWVETTLLPMLQESFPDNEFIKQLYIGSTRNPLGSWNTVISVPVNFNMVDNPTFDVNYDKAKYSSIYRGFMDVKDRPISAITGVDSVYFGDNAELELQDILYLYNLITTRNNNTPRGLGNLFYTLKQNDGGELRKKYKQDESTIDYNFEEYIEKGDETLLKDVQILTAPTVTPHQKPPKGFKYFRMIKKGKVYICTKKERNSNSDFDSDDSETVIDEFGNYTSSYSYNSESLLHYTLALRNRSESLLISDVLDNIPDTYSEGKFDNLEDTLKLLIQYNKLRLNINCK